LREKAARFNCGLSDFFDFPKKYRMALVVLKGWQPLTV